MQQLVQQTAKRRLHAVPELLYEKQFYPQLFLSPDRPRTPFIRCAKEVEELMRFAFHSLMGYPFPENLRIQVISAQEMKIHEKQYNLLGFAINRHPLVSDIVVKEAPLDELMLTLGHELGHVLSSRKKDIIQEEHKAFAFSFWWLEYIRENNLGGLGSSYPRIIPAPNGIHDSAHMQVLTLHGQGMTFEEIYRLSLR